MQRARKASSSLDSSSAGNSASTMTLTSESDCWAVTIPLKAGNCAYGFR